MPPLPKFDAAGQPVSQPRPFEKTEKIQTRPPSRTGLWIVVGLAAAAALAVGVLFFGKPPTGRILVNLTDPKGAPISHAEIQVDGVKRCDSAPCVIEPVADGQHEVKALVEGTAAPLSQTVAVNMHRDTAVNFALETAVTTELKVNGTQPGVKLYVDDKDIGPLPQDIRDIAPGVHAIKLAGSERYQSFEKHVSIDPGQTVDLGTVTLKVLKGKATINAPTPAGVRVYLVSGTDRRELPVLPISVDIDTTKTWSVEASKPGFVDFKQPISFDDGQAEKTFSVTLQPKGAAAPVAVAAAPAPAPAPRPAPAAAPAISPGPALAAAAAEGGEGFLNINSIPPSTCFLDGKSLGSTPRVHVSVKPGTHTVKFVNADQGLTKTVSVQVGAGETKPAVAKLSE